MMFSNHRNLNRQLLILCLYLKPQYEKKNVNSTSYLPNRKNKKEGFLTEVLEAVNDTNVQSELYEVVHDIYVHNESQDMEVYDDMVVENISQENKSVYNDTSQDVKAIVNMDVQNVSQEVEAIGNDASQDVEAIVNMDVQNISQEVKSVHNDALEDVDIVHMDFDYMNLHSAPDPEVAEIVDIDVYNDSQKCIDMNILIAPLKTEDVDDINICSLSQEVMVVDNASQEVEAVDNTEALNVTQKVSFLHFYCSNTISEILL